MCVCYILRHLIQNYIKNQEPYNFCEYLYFPFKSILINSSSDSIMG